VRYPRFLAALAALMLVASIVDAQSPVRVRGTIIAIDGKTMTVKSRDGRELKLELSDALTVAVAKAARFEDIKEGDFLGATTQARPDGSNVALELHYLAPTVSEGQSSSDLLPGSTMTNANVASKVTATGAREVTLQYKNGSHKAMVPDGTPIVRTVPGTRADLVPGEYVFLIAQAADDGALTVARIQVSKDGVRPPQ
jgi:hypothetical protein